MHPLPQDRTEGFSDDCSANKVRECKMEENVPGTAAEHQSQSARVRCSTRRRIDCAGGEVEHQERVRFGLPSFRPRGPHEPRQSFDSFPIRLASSAMAPLTNSKWLRL